MTYEPGKLPNEEADPFDQLASPGEVCGFIHKRYGETGLRELLEGSPSLTREGVLDIASELRQAGLRTAAGIASEIASTKPAMVDLSFCPYTQPPYSETPGNKANISAWLQAQQHRQRARELKRSKPRAFKN